MVNNVSESTLNDFIATKIAQRYVYSAGSWKKQKFSCIERCFRHCFSWLSSVDSIFEKCAKQSMFNLTFDLDRNTNYLKTHQWGELRDKASDDLRDLNNLLSSHSSGVAIKVEDLSKNKKQTINKLFTALYHSYSESCKAPLRPTREERAIEAEKLRVIKEKEEAEKRERLRQEEIERQKQLEKERAEFEAAEKIRLTPIKPYHVFFPKGTKLGIYNHMQHGGDGEPFIELTPPNNDRPLTQLTESDPKQVFFNIEKYQGGRMDHLELYQSGTYRVKDWYVESNRDRISIAGHSLNKIIETLKDYGKYAPHQRNFEMTCDWNPDSFFWQPDCMQKFVQKLKSRKADESDDD